MSKMVKLFGIVVLTIYYWLQSYGTTSTPPKSVHEGDLGKQQGEEAGSAFTLQRAVKKFRNSFYL